MVLGSMGEDQALWVVESMDWGVGAGGVVRVELELTLVVRGTM